MRTATILSIIAFAATLVGPSVPAEAGRDRVLVVPFAGSDRVTVGVAKRATRRLVAVLRRERGIRVVTLPKRKARKLRRCLQRPECVRKIGAALRVRFIVAGHVTYLKRRVYADVRVVSADTGTVVASDTAVGRRPGTVIRRAPAVALRLVRRAPDGVKVATANTASDAQFVEEEIAMRPDGDSATVTVRDREDPNAKSADPAVAGLGLPTLSEGNVPRPAPSAATGAAPRSDTSFVKRFTHKRYWPALAAAGGTVIALAVATGFGATAMSANAEAADAQLQTRAWELRDKASKNATAGNVFFALSGAAAVTSAVLFYFAHKGEMAERSKSDGPTIGINVAKGGGGIAVGGSF